MKIWTETWGTLLMLAACILSGCQPISTSTIIPSYSEPVNTRAFPTAAKPSETSPLTPTAVPSITSTPLFTPHPKAPTFTPRVSPTPFIYPFFQTPPPDHLPEISENLLFVSSQNTLKRWNHLTGQVEVLIGPDAEFQENSAFNVIDYSPSLHSSLIAAWVLPADSPKTSQVTLLDLSTQQQFTVAQIPLPWPVKIALSPDGKWLAYIRPDYPLNPQGWSTPGYLSSFRSPLPGGSYTGKVWIIPTRQPEQAREIGSCTSERFNPNIVIDCRGILWSPDSQALAWSDGRGLWIFRHGETPRLLVENGYHPGGNGMGDFYVQISWSPSGDHLLVRSGHYEGSDRFFVDVASSVKAAIPGSHEYIMDPAQIIWLEDDRLFIVRPAERRNILAQPELPVRSEIWYYDPLTASVIKEMGLDVSFPETAEPPPYAYPYAPAQISAHQFAWAMLNNDPKDTLIRGIYVFDLDRQEISRRVDLPPISQQSASMLEWASDGSTAILSMKDHLILIDISNSRLYELLPILEAATNFTWMPDP